MEIKIKFLEVIRDATGEKQTVMSFNGIDSINLGELIIEMMKKYGKNFNKLLFPKYNDDYYDSIISGKTQISEISNIRFAINYKARFFDKNTVLKDGDQLVIFLPIVGG